MSRGTSHQNDGQSISSPEPKDLDRYSHIKTETVDIIYDTECDCAWIQATDSVLLEAWR